ncbi:hypothetical protein IHQ71_29195 (plasmid) [Rhizobium sp. TH2]|uniref:hypothetical protein n=1 Tax=Rhizobium sp. TH2 TaxID=2775403 RepID=UPI0021570B4E|nr:hypothetical protein [Rhizobium sp. TH2]UVC12305.1 hypothetical protein IHQ71_29195 [Rhizobium sp. TH2]
MSLWDLFSFKKAVDTARKASGAQTVPRLVEWIDAERIRHDRDPELVDGKTFTPGDCYFTLRLSGLHLADSRRFAVKVLPLFLCLAEFRSRGKPQTVPFSLGPNTIRQRLKEIQPDAPENEKARPGWVELRDIEIVRLMPVSLNNLQAFVGLYAVPGDDIARTLLNVMGSVSGALGGALAPALAVAEKVYSGFNELLGIDGVTPQVEALHGGLLKQSGYLLISNAPENSPHKGKLFVSGGRLRTGEAADSPLVTDFDYCLLAVQRRETIIDASGTAPDLFGTQWEEVIESFNGADGAATNSFRKLQRTIYGSELIARDRDAALAGYLLEFDKAAKVFGKPTEAAGLTRGGEEGHDLLSAVSGIPQIYGPLVEQSSLSLTTDEREALRSGESAWKRAAQLRNELANRDGSAGDVADAIMGIQKSSYGTN